MFSFNFNKRVDLWLAKRLPARKEITLNSSNTFIFPSKMGWYFLISCLILFLLGTNYQNNLILFLVFFLCSFMFTCLLLSYQNLAGLTITSETPEPQFAATDCQFKLTLQHAKTESQGLSFCFKKTRSKLQTTINSKRVVMSSFSPKRGYFNPGRVTIKSSFPFGLFNVWTHLDFDFNVLLYPEPIENSLTASQSAGDKSQVHFLQQNIAGVEQFTSLKNYQVGESLKSVAWKQLAQGRGWLTKQFEQSTGGDLILDISHLNYLPVEKRLSYLAYLIVDLENKQQSYSLVLYQQRIDVGLGKSHKEKCLRALALFNDTSLTDLSATVLPSDGGK